MENLFYVPRTLNDALDGFYAYYIGFTDSGIQDPELSDKVFGYLASLDEVRRAELVEACIAEKFSEDEDEDEDYDAHDAETQNDYFRDWVRQMTANQRATEGTKTT